MNRPTHSNYGTHAQQALQAFHTNVLQEVQENVAREPVVVVGMALNPYVLAVRYALTKAGIDYTYLGYGGYLTKWKPRLAIKMWSGWPTFPQVFVRGTLIGGNSCTRKALKDGSFSAMLEQQQQETSS